MFGYGSLPAAGRRVVPPARPPPRLGRGHGQPRGVPGYKIYRDPETGERPPVHVAYLSVTPERGESVDGYAFEVTDGQLEALLRRDVGA